MRGSATAVLLCVCAAWSPTAVAEEVHAPDSGSSVEPASERELARRSENPIEDMVSVPVQENLDYGIGSYDRANSTLKIEPRIPIHVLASWNVLTRTIIPFMYKADESSATGGSSGLGDINPTFFISPAHPGALIWGLGPDFVLPTATQTSLGAGKWSVGPALALAFQPKPFSFAMIVSNIWSFAGQSGSSSVNEGSLQYFVHYNFGSGWSLKSSPTMTAEWNKAAGDVWEVPVGGGVAKVFKWRKVAINPSLAAYDYVLKRSDSPDWELRCEVSFLFPE
jgi:Putative MetA-pathway of phenol degradation